MLQVKRQAVSGFRNQFRYQSTKVAIIGSGPAGFYTAYHLLKKGENLKVDIFEKLPVPYGLSRYGVAPDHPEVKNCQDTFKELGKSADFKFFGNVEVGKDITLQELKDNYHCIVMSYGCDDDNVGAFAKIPGMESKGVLSARKFVGWYNGLPALQDLNPPLEKVEDVVIIGNGNVALDVTRALLAPTDFWRSTDMTENAIEKLSRSGVKNVRIVARRGFLESAFTNKEFRELLDLKSQGIIFNFINPEQLQPIAATAAQLGRIHKRRFDLVKRAMLSNANLEKEQIKKTWMLDYLKSPIEVVQSPTDPEILESTTFAINKLAHESPMGDAKIVGTDSTVTYKSELLITSTGYKGRPIPGFDELAIPFDPKTGTIGNVGGRVVSKHDYNQYLKGFYASGWISIGAQGVIMSTMMNGFQTGDFILEDLHLYKDELRSGADGVEKLLHDRNVRFVSWKDWETIEKHEFNTGFKKGKIREKLCNVQDMLSVL